MKKAILSLAVMAALCMTSCSKKSDDEEKKDNNQDAPAAAAPAQTPAQAPTQTPAQAPTGTPSGAPAPTMTQDMNMQSSDNASPSMSDEPQRSDFNSDEEYMQAMKAFGTLGNAAAGAKNTEEALDATMDVFSESGGLVGKAADLYKTAKGLEGKEPEEILGSMGFDF